MHSRTQVAAVVDPGGFLGFHRTPLFVLVTYVNIASCACTSTVKNIVDSGTPPFKILDPPLGSRSTRAIDHAPREMGGTINKRTHTN